MNRVFSARGFVELPDGTDLSAFLNATDDTQDEVPWGVLGEMGIAVGRIRPGVHSQIHVHPFLVQVTYVVSGGLSIRMKDLGADAAYDLALAAGQAVVTPAGTLFQLRNDADALAEVLYIVSPSYVFEQADGKVIYDDAVLLGNDWGVEEVQRFDQAALEGRAAGMRDARVESTRRMAAREGVRL
jgi:mannose-6-phosphate isomerase-like protein (cupin superfamily)